MNLALRPKNLKPGRFYTLPKVHKPFVTVPTSRPIVGGNGTVTEMISLFLDHYLIPYVPKLRSYVHDDMEFLRKIETVNENGPLPPNVILATMDVSSLYTNIPTQELIDACCAFLTQEFTNDQFNSFCKLMEIVLTPNNFTFDGDHYVQVFGTSIGSKMAPSMACLFMGSLKDRLLNSYSKKTIPMVKVHRWCFLALDTWPWRIPKLCWPLQWFPSSHQVHNRDFLSWNPIPGCYGLYQRWRSSHWSVLKTYWFSSVSPLDLLPSQAYQV